MRQPDADETPQERLEARIAELEVERKCTQAAYARAAKLCADAVAKCRKLEAAQARIATLEAEPRPATPGVEEARRLYQTLDDDSLDAIVEVIGSPALYNNGKSAMRDWFLRRLRRLWNLPEPDASPAKTEG